jgi:diguanylate cyclase (GGDEF)-like protein
MASKSATSNSGIFSPREVDALVSAGSTIDFAPQQAIFRRGDSGDSLYVVLGGEVEIRFGREKATKRLGKGEVFGELALLTPAHLRTASVIATRESTLCKVGAPAVEALSQTAPGVVFSVLRKACVYLLASEQALVADLSRKNTELQDTMDYLRRTSEELSYQELLAQTDELTGLYNRRCLTVQIERFIDRAHSSDNQLALIALDLDGLKPINDMLGHPTGDEVLRHIGSVLKQCVRKSDFPFRVGGDEFSVLLTGIDPELARTRAAEIRAAIAVPISELGDVDVHVTVSIGGTMLEPADSAAGFIERADRHLYEAKQAGGNRVSWMGQILESA